MTNVEREGSLPWPIPAADGLRRRLLDAYAEPGRCYHDQRHLAEVLQRIEELRDAGEAFDHTSVVLAAWFHDAVYDREPAAEERSALWAERALAEVGAPADLIAEVARLVRLTAHHDPEPGDLDGAVLSDADLAILAADESRYAEYVAAVRAEYAAVPDDQFDLGRSAILEDLAGRPYLFRTSHARARWEDAARTNLEKERGGRAAR
jgi:predicted metal-dependent HD superfamily phosphohydrolase